MENVCQRKLQAGDGVDVRGRQLVEGHLGGRMRRAGGEVGVLECSSGSASRPSAFSSRLHFLSPLRKGKREPGLGAQRVTWRE